eukprot:1642599-Lingulodinium_polyedra.AAC.1
MADAVKVEDYKVLASKIGLCDANFKNYQVPILARPGVFFQMSCPSNSILLCYCCVEIAFWKTDL